VGRVRRKIFSEEGWERIKGTKGTKSFVGGIRNSFSDFTSLVKLKISYLLDLEPLALAV